MSPGHGALWKPQMACSVKAPAKQTMKSAKLALRTVYAKPGCWPEVTFCRVPPRHWDKLWCTVRLTGGHLRR
eukprot:4970644-Lingulodinium_polyedra.AAC.1